jgi:hypothetical protein
MKTKRKDARVGDLGRFRRDFRGGVERGVILRRSKMRFASGNPPNRLIHIRVGHPRARPVGKV